MNSISPVFKIEFDKNRVYGLDIIRALAILFVVLGHSTDLLPDTIDKRIFYIIPFPDGVSVFFVLSGFLIGGILVKILEQEKPSFRALLSFWKRRWYRTLPAYYFILVVLILLNIFFDKKFDVQLVPRYFIFLQNFSVPHPIFFIEAWSLSVEEWFYLLIPFFIFTGLIFFRVKPRRMVLVCIVTIILFTVLFRYYRYLTIPVTSEKIWGSIFRGQVVTRLDSLMFGVLGSYLAYYHNTFWLKHRQPFFYLGIALMILMKILNDYLLSASVFYFCNVSFLLTEISVLLVFPLLSQIKQGSGLIYKFITYTSLISYSMYLTHASLILHWIVTNIWYVPSANTKLIAARYIVFWIVTFLFSILLYKNLEMPFMKYRDRKIKSNDAA